MGPKEKLRGRHGLAPNALRAKPRDETNRHGDDLVENDRTGILLSRDPLRCVANEDGISDPQAEADEESGQAPGPDQQRKPNQSDQRSKGAGPIGDSAD